MNDKRHESHPWIRLAVVTSLLMAAPILAQQAPPELGEETKGTPAVDETTGLPTADSSSSESVVEPPDSRQQPGENTSGIDSLLGRTTITESRRESGQVYMIELEHSSGARQYIEETDSDGKIESTSNDIEETPNLPKWKLGSW